MAELSVQRSPRRSISAAISLPHISLAASQSRRPSESHVTPTPAPATSSFRSFRNLLPFGPSSNPPSTPKPHPFASLRRSFTSERKNSASFVRPSVEDDADKYPVIAIEPGPSPDQCEREARITRSAPDLFHPPDAHDSFAAKPEVSVGGADLSTILEAENSGISKHIPFLDDDRSPSPESSIASPHHPFLDGLRSPEPKYALHPFGSREGLRSHPSRDGLHPHSNSPDPLLNVSTSRLTAQVIDALKPPPRISLEHIPSDRDHDPDASFNFDALDPDLAALLSPHRVRTPLPPSMSPASHSPSNNSPYSTHSHSHYALNPEPTFPHIQPSTYSSSPHLHPSSSPHLRPSPHIHPSPAPSHLLPSPTFAFENPNPFPRTTSSRSPSPNPFSRPDPPARQSSPPRRSFSLAASASSRQAYTPNHHARSVSLAHAHGPSSVVQGASGLTPGPSSLPRLATGSPGPSRLPRLTARARPPPHSPLSSASASAPASNAYSNSNSNSTSAGSGPNSAGSSSGAASSSRTRLVTPSRVSLESSRGGDVSPAHGGGPSETSSPHHSPLQFTGSSTLQVNKRRRAHLFLNRKRSMSVEEVSRVGGGGVGVMGRPSLGDADRARPSLDIDRALARPSLDVDRLRPGLREDGDQARPGLGEFGEVIRPGSSASSRPAAARSGRTRGEGRLTVEREGRLHAGPPAMEWLGPRTVKAFAAAGLLDEDERPRERERERYVPSRMTFSEAGSTTSWGNTMSTTSRGNRPHMRSMTPSTHTRCMTPSTYTRTMSPSTATGGSPTFSAPRTHSGSSAPTSVSYTPTSLSQGTHNTPSAANPQTTASQSQSQSQLALLKEKHDLETEVLLSALSDSQRTTKALREENWGLRARVGELEEELERVREELRARGEAQAQSFYRQPASKLQGSSSRLQRPYLPRSRSQLHQITMGPGGGSGEDDGTGEGGEREEREPESRYARRRASTTSSVSVFPNLPPNMSMLMHEPDAAPPSPIYGAGFGGRRRRRSSSLGSPARECGDVLPGAEEFTPTSAPTSAYVSASTSPYASSPTYASSSPTAPAYAHSVSTYTSSTPTHIPIPVPTHSSAANISPTTANFSMTEMTGSPGSLQLRPEHEQHLGDMASLSLYAMSDGDDEEGDEFDG
ncbi:hypothetical protein BV22DRAFT_1120398 [Leucogyrophana mollusca]|uniref:Uncharacterized protein n=1 Tax=Leucogyrophana mollusca TaxID=85980 RepID=A0ACB8BEE0_9AGAM|nr:hypothetical protein BV22DRAFT_1120398 [Leucogyrophana mollusca]